MDNVKKTDHPRLLIISNYSGAPNPIRPEAEIILALAERGYQIWVMTPGSSAYIDKLRHAGCSIIDHRIPSKFHLPSISLIRSIIKKHDIDLVQAFYSKAIANAAWATAFNRHVKLVSYRGYTGNIHWYDPSLYLSFLNPRIDKMICLAESVRERYIANGVSRSRVVTIHKGHSALWYQDVAPADLSEFNIPAGALTCSFVANHRTRMKGLKYLIKALGMLEKEVNIHVLLIGKGLDSQAIKKLIDAEQVSDKITFTGFRADALNIVKACDVAISLSLFGEATQKAMIEAMYMERPVIMTAISGNKGMLIDQIGGYLVPPAEAEPVANALRSMYASPVLRKEMGVAAKEHISTFLSIDKSIEAYHQCYTTLVSNKID